MNTSYPRGVTAACYGACTGYWFYEERDGGVYVECESVTLTRDVPFGMGALVAPIIRNVPGESLRSALEHTRQGVLREPR